MDILEPYHRSTPAHYHTEWILGFGWQSISDNRKLININRMALNGMLSVEKETELFINVSIVWLLTAADFLLEIVKRRKKYNSLWSVLSSSFMSFNHHIIVKTFHF